MTRRPPPNTRPARRCGERPYDATGRTHTEPYSILFNTLRFPSAHEQPPESKARSRHKGGSVWKSGCGESRRHAAEKKSEIILRLSGVEKESISPHCCRGY